MLQVKESVIAKISKSGNLPTLPEILIKLIDACEDDSRPLADIADIICKDPSLSFKVLQLVNSAYYGFRKSFTSIEQAVIYLGANTVKNVAVTTAIHQVFERKRFKKIKLFDIRGFWWQSLFCATLAKRIAHKVGFSNFDEAYLTGLLHDIGRIVLISTFPKEHESILLETKEPQNTLWAETQLIGATHCDVGAWLIKEWNLTSLMADAIQYHHEPLEKVIESYPLVKIIYLASLLSYNTAEDQLIEKTGKELFGLKFDETNEILSGTSEEVEDIAKSLEIRIKRPDSPETAPPQTNGASSPEEKPEQLEPTPDEASLSGEIAAQQELTGRIKNISLLTGFLENLSRATGSDEIFGTFEQCVHILLDIDTVLFFLPDEHQILLKGAASSASPFNQIGQDLTLPLQSSSSKIVQAYRSMSPTYLTSDDMLLNTADSQTLKILDQRTILILPITAERAPAGIILLGLPSGATSISISDRKLLQVIAGQIGLSLHVERLKVKQKEELEAERIAAVSMTAKKFAHEINNPLGIISNYITALNLKLSSETGIQEDLNIITEEIQRISSMVNQLDLFAQPVSRSIQTVDINNVLQDIINLVKTSMFEKAGTMISFLPQSSLPPVETSRDAVKQIIINLVKNASEAMDDGGNINISTRLIGEGSGQGNGTNGIEITVADNGPGLPPEVQENLFKPFVTTKNEGHSGLGLSIVYKAVSVLGGKITCKSEQSLGTSFSVFLPLEKPLK